MAIVIISAMLLHTFATGSLKHGSYESYATNVQKNGTYNTHLKYLESIYIDIT